MILRFLPESSEKTMFIKKFGKEYIPICFENSHEKSIIAKIRTPEMLCAACCDAPYNFEQDEWASKKLNIKGIDEGHVCSWIVRSDLAINK